MNKVTDVYIVDDDQPARDSLALLLRTCGLNATTFESADDFLHSIDSIKSGCIILDVRMPGLSGLSLHEILLNKGYKLPVIFVTAHGDIRMAVDTMATGAFYFLSKPYREQELIDKIQEALLLETKRILAENIINKKQESIQQLTCRETEIIELIAKGTPNKKIAYDLGISERTIEVHRSNMMKKLGVNNAAELVNWYVDTKSHLNT